MNLLGPDATVTAEAKRDAIERAEARADYVVMWSDGFGSPKVSGHRGRVTADELRDSLLGRGLKDIQVLRVVEDYDA